MPSESIHEKLQRVRRPHVHIKYEVFTDGAKELHELPFVVGVMGDFSGDSLDDMEPLRERKFKEVNRDNFDTMLKSMKPKLTGLVVPNHLGDSEDEMLTVSEIKFESMNDFSPAGVAAQVPELAALLKKREEIEELKRNIELSRALEKDIDKFVKDVSSKTPEE